MSYLPMNPSLPAGKEKKKTHWRPHNKRPNKALPPVRQGGPLQVSCCSTYKLVAVDLQQSRTTGSRWVSLHRGHGCDPPVHDWNIKEGFAAKQSLLMCVRVHRKHLKTNISNARKMVWCSASSGRSKGPLFRAWNYKTMLYFTSNLHCAIP